MSARKLVLLVAILACGALIEAAHGVRDELSIGPTGCRVLSGRFYGPSFEFEQEAGREGTTEAGIVVENAFGGVTVKGTATEGVRTKLRTRVYAPDREKAEAFAERVEIRFDERDGRLRVATNREELTGSGRRTPGFETRLELEVPVGTPVEVRSHHSRVALRDVGAAAVRASYEPVTVAGASGDVRIDTRHASVTLESLAGALHLDASHGDVSLEGVRGRAQLGVRHGAVTAREVGGLKLSQSHGDLEAAGIAGDLEVEGNHAAVRARDVTGAARVETSFGEIRLERLGGPVRAVTRHARLRVEQAEAGLTAEVSDGRAELTAIAGPLELTARRSDVRVSGLREGGRIEGSGGDVEVADHAGPLEVRVRLGDVRLFPSAPIGSPITAESREAGSVILEIDPADAFRLEAEARRGDVRVDVPGFETSRREGGKVGGSVGDGGLLITLRAQRGDVVVRTRER